MDDEKPVTKNTFTITREQYGAHTLHDLIADLSQTLNLTPEQQFLVTAKIKRYVHHEKHDVYSRYARYAQRGVNIEKFLRAAADNHAEWAQKPDAELVTWDVGTHQYKRNE